MRYRKIFQPHHGKTNSLATDESRTGTPIIKTLEKSTHPRDSSDILSRPYFYDKTALLIHLVKQSQADLRRRRRPGNISLSTLQRLSMTPRDLLNKLL